VYVTVFSENMRFSTALLIAGAEVALAQNGPGGCSPLQLVYARATGEPAASKRTWSQGYGAAGKSLVGNVTAMIPGSDGYAVNYPAAMGTENQGAADMIRHLNEKVKACPNTVYALGGHSQGGFAVVNAAPKMSKEVLAKVIAVTMFGSPACPAQLRSRCISYCASGDSVCASRPPSTPGKGRFVVEDMSLDQLNDMLSSTNNLQRRQGKFGKGGAGGAGGAGGSGPGDCSAKLSMKTSGLGKGGHMGYNADGTYVKAAACYIKQQYDKHAGGAKSGH
jgi:hypothetical protein